MSAYIVSKQHIDFLVEELTRSGSLYGTPQIVCGLSSDRVGEILIAENIASVSYRYGGESLDTLPGPVDKRDLLDYHFEHPAPMGNREVRVLKAVQGYTYQSCEHPGWPESQAARWMEELTSAMISALPGYEEAAWTL